MADLTKKQAAWENTWNKLRMVGIAGLSDKSPQPKKRAAPEHREEIEQIIAKAPATLSVQDFQTIERNLGLMIEHENELMNHRIQWFITIMGFLFTATAIAGSLPERGPILLIMAVLGVLTSLSFGCASILGGRAWERLHDIWFAYVAAYVHEGSEFPIVGIYGYRLPPRRLVLWILRPWVALPWFFCLGWIGAGLLAWYSTPHAPPGTFVRGEDGRLFNSRTKELDGPRVGAPPMKPQDRFELREINGKIHVFDRANGRLVPEGHADFGKDLLK